MLLSSLPRTRAANPCLNRLGKNASIIENSEQSSKKALKKEKPHPESKFGKDFWSSFMVQLVRSKICLRYLSDKEVERIVNGARKYLEKQVIPVADDPDLPECFYWDEVQVGEWISGQGYPHLKEAFVLNRLTGRKLVSVDGSALVKMGIRKIEEIREVSSKIRELLGIPRPNMMRALMRLAPFENYLKKRTKTGKNYDNTNFELFCSAEGFPYKYLMANSKNAEIPCTCPVTINLGSSKDESPPCSSSNSENSLTNVPTVEFVAHRVLVHNQVVQQLIEELLVCVVDDPGPSNKHMCARTMKKIIDNGCSALNLSPEKCRERIEFINQVAQSLISEAQRTTEVLQSIEDTQVRMKKSITEQELELMREAALAFIEQVFPLAALLTFSDLNLERMFEDQLDFDQARDEINTSFEEKMKVVVPQAEEIVNDIISTAENYLNSPAYHSEHPHPDNLNDE